MAMGRYTSDQTEDDEPGPVEYTMRIPQRPSASCQIAADMGHRNA
jgi:hypothetical protein